MKKYLLTAVLIPLTLITALFAQTQQQIINATAFTKLYGYTRFFYPGDEAAEINWNSFAKFGHQKVSAAVNDMELKNVLTELFQPIVPALVITASDHLPQFNMEQLFPAGSSAMKTIAWQHKGVSYGLAQNIYESARSNRPRKNYEGNVYNRSHAFLFKSYPHVGEICRKEIAPGFWIQFPLALYGDQDHTYPIADTQRLRNLQDAVSAFDRDSITVLYSNLADITIGWTIIRHFFPYFDHARSDWSQSLEKAVRKTYGDRTRDEFLTTLQLMMAVLNDGHLSVSEVGGKKKYLPPIEWEWIEGKLVLTDVTDSTSGLKKGMIVTAIDEIASSEFFDSVHKTISGATEGYKNFLAGIFSLTGEKDSPVQLTAGHQDGEQKKYKLSRALQPSGLGMFVDGHDSLKLLSNGNWYINVSTASMASIRKILPELKKASTIICDLRGYPASNHEFLRYLLKRPDTSSAWMQVPQFIYPDQDSGITWLKFSWKLRPLAPHLKAKIIYITDGRAISYAESYLSFVKHYKLGTIVGQTTAGTNGNINRIFLPGGYQFAFTGMKVLQHDGSPHHGVGIRPDVYVEKTIKGVMEGRDEFLEKAIELAGR